MGRNIIVTERFEESEGVHEMAWPSSGQTEGLEVALCHIFSVDDFARIIEITNS